MNVKCDEARYEVQFGSIARSTKPKNSYDEAKFEVCAHKWVDMSDGKYVGFVTRRCFLKAPRYNVILMDHNESRQSIKGIETANILEIIDHHRLDALKTELPIFIP